MIKKVIAIEEDPQLISDANGLLLRTENSNDANDEVEINVLIDRILKYTQDKESSLMFSVKDKPPKCNITIQFIPYRPMIDGTVEKLYVRKWEIKKRCKDKVREIHIRSNGIDIFSEKE